MSAIPFLNNVDLNGNQWLNAALEGLPTAPTGAGCYPGRVYYNTTNLYAWYYNGNVWRPLDAAALNDGSISLSALATNPLARANHTGTQTASTISDLATTVKAYTLDSFAAPVAPVNLNAMRLFNGAIATQATDVPRWDQVQAAIAAAVAGQTAAKNPVRAYLTGGVVTLTGLMTVDGVVLVDGDRVLVNFSGGSTSNVIWIAHAGAWTIAPDNAAQGQLVEGTDVLIAEGTQYAGTIWRVGTAGAIVPGTTSVQWLQVAKINTYSADNITMTLAGLVFSVKIDPSGCITSSASGISVDKTKVVLKAVVQIVGDGATTSFSVAHTLNSQAIDATTFDATWRRVMLDYQATTNTNVTFNFAKAPGVGVVYNALLAG